MFFSFRRKYGLKDFAEGERVYYTAGVESEETDVLAVGVIDSFTTNGQCYIRIEYYKNIGLKAETKVNSLVLADASEVSKYR